MINGITINQNDWFVTSIYRYANLLYKLPRVSRAFKNITLAIRWFCAQ